MKRHALRRLRAALAKTPVWAIYEPAFAALVGGDLVGGEFDMSERLISGELSGSAIQARMPITPVSASNVQMVGSTAIVPITGVIQQRPNWLTRELGWTATSELAREINSLLANDQVRSIVLLCDSPGGASPGCHEAAEAIFAGRGVKPIVGFSQGMCASAAYHLLAACQAIHATPSSTIGSIGTILTHVEYSDYLKSEGIGATVIKHGERKGDGNPHEKLSAEARASLQEYVSSFGAMFEADVAKYRGVDVAAVKARFGQGNAFIASEALSRGLIDRIGSLDELLAKLQQPASSVLAVMGVSAGASVTVTSQFAADVSAAHETFRVSAKSPSDSASDQAFQGGIVMKKVRAWLFAKGLIASQDVSDDVVKGILAGYFAGRGQDVPEAEDKILEALTSAAATPQAGATPAPSPTSPAPAAPAAGAPANNVQAAHDREVAEARAASRADERQRLGRIRSSGRILGMSEEAIETACNSDQSHAQILEAWTDQLAAENAPITAPASGAAGAGAAGGAGGGVIRIGADGHERYIADATLASLLHFGQGDAIPAAQITPQIRQLASAPLIVHAEACLRAAGVRFDPYDREDTARQAMAMGGYERTTIRSEGIAYNRPGAFPDLLSALATKILDQGVEAAETSYQDYTGLWPGDLPDFKPAPVVAKGQVGELDEVLDAEAFKEAKLDQECLSYMQLARFGNQVALTPVLLANDDLSAFMEDLLGLADGWELTQNRGCLRLVTGNVRLLDGFDLYDGTNHGNVITTPGNGVPSTTSWDYMQQKMAAQQTIGNKARTRARLAVALVTPKHEVAAIQTFAPMRDLAEMKTPAVDSNLNVYRGRVKVVIEPDLQDYSNDIWYGFSDPRRFRNATIVRAYFRGWGQRGKRERWYDPKTKCWHVSLEGRAGFAAKQYRTTVRNPGS